MIDMVEAVYEFHEKIVNLPFPKEARMLPDERRSFAFQAFLEETYEMEAAEDFNEQVDAILDLIYFAIGRMYEMGIPKHIARTYFENVHKANMNKLRGVTKRGSEDDATKPEGWQPPFHDIGLINK